MDSRCPLKLSKLPTSPCEEGRKAVDAERKGLHAGCPWFINDRESNYCFFKYMKDNDSSSDTATIARLNMIDDSEVKKIIQKFKKQAAPILQDDKE